MAQIYLASTTLSARQQSGHQDPCRCTPLTEAWCVCIKQISMPLSGAQRTAHYDEHQTHAAVALWCCYTVQLCAAHAAASTQQN
eukprot:6211937-Pleurochrysis_carterae.AAC.2